jgi:tetratricopeptide (TPR) repeat protein
MNMRLRVTAAVLLALVLSASQSFAQTLPGVLESGPHAVGFRIVTHDDASRPTAANRVRPLRMHVWYPAAAGGARLTVGDYLQIAGPQAATHRQDLPRTMGLTLTDAEWTQYTGFALLATRDVAPAAGQFPLIVGMYRAPSVVASAEHLASHGYVVAFVERQPRESVLAEGLVREGLILGEYVRDMQVAVARLRQEPFVDPARLGAHGFSGDGLAQTVFAMRHPDVRAVSLLEVGWLSPAQVSSYSAMPAYDPLAMRAAVFYAYSENLGRNSLEHISELTGMRYGPRSLLYLGEPRMTHLDFVTEGLVLTQTLARREAARPALTRMSQAMHRYQLTFFDAYLKGDAAATARLSELPVPKSGGALVELTHLPAIVPALTRAEFQNLVDTDITKALARAREDLARDPRAAVFDQVWLNATGYALIPRKLHDRAIAVFTIMTEAYPRSADAFDSYSEALEGAGRRAEALAAAEKALALLPGDTTVAAPQRAPLEAALRARVARLR